MAKKRYGGIELKRKWYGKENKNQGGKEMRAEAKIAL